MLLHAKSCSATHGRVCKWCLFLLFLSKNKAAGPMLFACWGGAPGAALNNAPTTRFFPFMETTRADNVDSNTAYYIPGMGQGLHKLLLSSTFCFLWFLRIGFHLLRFAIFCALTPRFKCWICAANGTMHLLSVRTACLDMYHTDSYIRVWDTSHQTRNLCNLKTFSCYVWIPDIPWCWIRNALAPESLCRWGFLCHTRWQFPRCRLWWATCCPAAGQTCRNTWGQVGGTKASRAGAGWQFILPRYNSSFALWSVTTCTICLRACWIFELPNALVASVCVCVWHSIANWLCRNNRNTLAQACQTQPTHRLKNLNKQGARRPIS